jgi:DNA-binding HxlR family transcriptional regulator
MFINMVVIPYFLGMATITKSEQIDQKTLDSCAVVHATWNEITRTWTLPTIHALGLQQPARFNELKRRINGISATSLAERLSQLEKFGVVQRKVIPDEHPRIEYSLTVKGNEVYDILCDLAKWSQRWAGKEPNSREFVVSN